MGIPVDTNVVTPRPLRSRVVFAMAEGWRRILDALQGPRFVGVTGSAGKTTTTKLIATSLSVAGRVRATDRLVGRLNDPRLAARLVLTTSPWHRFCVYELGTGGPGTLAEFVRVLRPHIGVVTNVAWDHHKVFRSLEATALEKRVLIEALPATGAAVLNGDDPRVLAMGACTRARVITFGMSPEVLVRGEDVSSAWPQRLSLTARYGTDRVRVQTRLVGEHWVHAVLAALATAIAAGVPLAEAARALEHMEPVEGRYSVHVVDGITFIRDDWKAPLWSIPAALRLMEMARARRKIVILGTITDKASRSSSRTYRSVGRQASAVVDKVIFVGQEAHHARGMPPYPHADRVAVFDTLYALDQFLQAYLQAGDLVLLKGSITADHLQRLVLSRGGQLRCYRPRCRRSIFCSGCELRDDPFVPSSHP